MYFGNEAATERSELLEKLFGHEMHELGKTVEEGVSWSIRPGESGVVRHAEEIYKLVSSWVDDPRTVSPSDVFPPKMADMLQKSLDLNRKISESKDAQDMRIKGILVIQRIIDDAVDRVLESSKLKP